jgi:hypothetical protein
VLRRLTLVLTAIAFVLTATLPSAAWTMATPAQAFCAHCPDKAAGRTGDLGKMVCGALACAGVAIALPARPTLCLRAFATLTYAPEFVAAIDGAPSAPDPYPPKALALG